MQIELIVSRLLKTPLRPQVCKNVCSYHGGWNSLSSSRRWRKSFFLQRCYLHSSTNYNVRLTQNAYTTKEMLTNVFTDVDGVQRPIEDYSEKTKVMFYEMFKEVNEEYVNVQKFITAIQVTGIQPHTDPRLKDFINGLTKAYRESGILGGSSESQKLSKEKFMELISPNLMIISRALRHDLVIPDFGAFQKQIEEFYMKCAENKEGHVASYLPQLARQNPDTWAVSVCTIDGQRFSMGEANVAFTLHSLTKPMTYALALNELGDETVHRYIGQEPSGRNANELVLDDNKKPHNPMISAGAILVGALLQTLCKPEMGLAEKFDFVVNYIKRLAGGEFIGFNNSVFLAEKAAGDRNYALGFYLREHKCYPKGTDLRQLIDFFHQCCSLEGNCNSLSVIAATFANGGVCPLTGDRILEPDAIRDVLSLMHSCGMYEYSGQFAFKVGLPSKSAAPGTMMVVIPNVMGICTWSPPLDKWNNSCRGVQFFEEIVKIFSFHHYDNPKHARGKKDPCKERFASRGLSIVNLLYSAARGDIAALRRHKVSGMDMSQTDYDKRTALHLAAAEGHLPCVSFLIDQCKLPLNCKDRWGKTPLDEARTFGRLNVAEYLDKRNALLNAPESQGSSEGSSDEEDSSAAENEVKTEENK
ncbi:glutaminase liver isoform, mitochondrial-like [Homalodisca vitripennis]|uniref:glutaminase liver isoform, mitochondrial-like n=1 Tax=Homalodisca vitripennis TaxID=197043 RepID=UPI001EEACE1E|nr:glutaminase liver isoform, mitochondrial-like [Homalodisca vitripennis]